MVRKPEALNYNMYLVASLVPLLFALGVKADYDFINITACPSDRVDTAIRQCIWKHSVGHGDFVRRMISGFPWYPYTLKHTGYSGSAQHFNVIMKTGLGGINAKGGLLDPLDNLGGICKDFDKASYCLEEHQTQDFCLLLSSRVFGSFEVFKTFEFFCRNQTRDENLLRSLRCLHDTRLPSMLYYHISTECRQGMDILDQRMLARKRRFLYDQNSRIKIEPTFKL